MNINDDIKDLKNQKDINNEIYRSLNKDIEELIISNNYYKKNNNYLEDMNNKLNNNINNINYEIKENNIELSKIFHKNLLKIIKDQEEINNNLIKNINELNTKIEYIYYYIGIIVIIILF